MSISIQQINSKQALVQVENAILNKDPSIKRYLQSRCQYEDKWQGYIIEKSEISFMREKINFQISAKQKKKKVSEIPSFVSEAFSEIGNRLEVKNSRGNVISEILYGNEKIANDLGLSQQHISDGVQLAFQMKGRVILADDPGLNSCQTAVNIAYAYDYKIPFLIVASSTQRQKWKSILKQQFNLKDKEIQILYNDTTQLDFTKDVFILTYEQTVRRKEELKTIKVALVDEAHFLRNTKYASERTLLEYLCLRKRVVLLSNSCVIQSTEDLYPLMRVIRPDCFYDIKAFNERYANLENTWIELHSLLKHTGTIRRTRAMFSDNLNDQTFANFGFVSIETDKYISSTINRLLMTAHKIRGNFSKGVYSQCYSLSLEAKIQGCLQFIDQQLESKPNDKIVVLGYHQNAFERVQNHLLEKNVLFFNIEKKMTYANKENLLQQIDPEVRVVMMSYTNLQDLELSQFSTAIILEVIIVDVFIHNSSDYCIIHFYKQKFSWHPHLIDQAIGCLYSLHQTNDQVDVFILEGVATLDKVLKGKFIKWLNMKSRILDGKQIDQDLNTSIADVVTLENNRNQNVRSRQNQSFDIEYSVMGRQNVQVSRSIKPEKEKKKRSRQNISEKKKEKVTKKANSKIKKANLHGEESQDLLPSEIKIDINQSKKQFLQKARTVEQMKKIPISTKVEMMQTKRQKNIQNGNNSVDDIEEEIEDDIENITNYMKQQTRTNLFSKKQQSLNTNNQQIMQKNNLEKEQDDEEKVFMTDSDFFHEGFISVEQDDLDDSNQSKNQYSRYQKKQVQGLKKTGEENEEEEEEEEDITDDKYSNRKKHNFLDEINCDFDISEIDNHEVDSMQFGSDETPINKYFSQQSHHSVYKQIISKISTTPIQIQDPDEVEDDEDDDDDYEDEQELIRALERSKQKIAAASSNKQTQNTPRFKLQTQANLPNQASAGDDLDYLLKELDIEFEFDNEEENKDSEDLLRQSKTSILEDEDGSSEMLPNPQQNKIFKTKIPLQMIIDDEQNNESSNENNQVLVKKGRILGTEDQKLKQSVPLKQQPFCRKLFEDDEFSSPFGFSGKESVMTKCSTNHFPNENSTKKIDSNNVFDRLILDIDDDNVIPSPHRVNKPSSSLKNVEFDEFTSIKGQNAIGFDSKSISVQSKAQQLNQIINQNKEKFKTESIYCSPRKQNQVQEIMSNENPDTNNGSQKRFTGLRKRKQDNSVRYDPKTLLSKKKVKQM